MKRKIRDGVDSWWLGLGFMERDGIEEGSLR